MNETSHDNKQLILIVDDDLTSRLLMRASLEKAGFSIIEADDGLQAIEAFKKDQPSAILLDVMMPNMNGFDACKAIRALDGGENIPILMVTGLEDLDAIHRSFDSGGTDFITKPINWAILNYRVKYMLRASNAFQDVIAKQKQIKALEFYDHLTGLANRMNIKETIETCLNENRKDESMLAVLFMDLDRFKTINDTLGRHAGDILLKQVSDRIFTVISNSDAVGRYTKITKSCISRVGGDEFAILIPKLQDTNRVANFARQLNCALEEPFTIEGKEVFTSTSIGISIYPFDGDNVEALLKNADLAMYHAKEQGKNNFQFFKKELNVEAGDRLDFENEVRKAVQNEDFALFYQPQIDLQSGQIIAAEALTRWQHAQRGSVSPALFIPAIEDLGLITPFTDWVIRCAGEQHSEWRKAGIEKVRTALNISSKQFLQQQIPEKITSILERHNLPADSIELELTESVLAERSDETLNVLRKLKDLGLSISVDDFGTGYSSLVYLKAFPIDIVKIDRFFIKDILTSKQDAAIVKAIVALAHSMEMKVVAEGIEEVGQYQLLKEIGCDFGQGFLFSPAVSADLFGDMVSTKINLTKSV